MMMRIRCGFRALVACVTTLGHWGSTVADTGQATERRRVYTYCNFNNAVRLWSDCPSSFDCRLEI